METILATLITLVLYLPLGAILLLDVLGLHLGRYDGDNALPIPGA